MELPLAPQMNQPTADVLIRAIKRVSRIVARTVSQETDLDGAVAFVSTDYPDIEQANFAAEFHLTDDSEAQAIFSRVIEHFGQAGVSCAAMDVAESTWPEALAQRIQSRGYVQVVHQVYALRQYAPPADLNRDLQIIPARAAYPEMRVIFKQQVQARHGGLDQAQLDQHMRARIDFLDEPRLEMFLGRLERKPVATAAVLSLGNIGVVCGVYTGRPQTPTVAQTLMAHLLDHCQRALFEQVIVSVAEQDPLASFYESLGFAPVASYERFVHERLLEST